MPGGDRRGPAGFGPMTGRGMGFCNGYPAPGYTTAPGGGRGFGRGLGRGRGWGFGYAHQAGPPVQYNYGMDAQPPANPDMPAENEVEFLRNKVSYYEDSIKELNSRIESLEKQKDS